MASNAAATRLNNSRNASLNQYHSTQQSPYSQQAALIAPNPPSANARVAHATSPFRSFDAQPAQQVAAGKNLRTHLGQVHASQNYTPVNAKMPVFNPLTHSFGNMVNNNRYATTPLEEIRRMDEPNSYSTSSIDAYQPKNLQKNLPNNSNSNKTVKQIQDAVRQQQLQVERDGVVRTQQRIHLDLIRQKNNSFEHFNILNQDRANPAFVESKTKASQPKGLPPPVAKSLQGAELEKLSRIPKDLQLVDNTKFQYIPVKPARQRDRDFVTKMKERDVMGDLMSHPEQTEARSPLAGGPLAPGEQRREWRQVQQKVINQRVHAVDAPINNYIQVNQMSSEGTQLNQPSWTRQYLNSKRRALDKRLFADSNQYKAYERQYADQMAVAQPLTPVKGDQIKKGPTDETPSLQETINAEVPSRFKSMAGMSNTTSPTPQLVTTPLYYSSMAGQKGEGRYRMDAKLKMQDFETANRKDQTLITKANRANDYWNRFQTNYNIVNQQEGQVTYRTTPFGTSDVPSGKPPLHNPLSISQMNKGVLVNKMMQRERGPGSGVGLPKVPSQQAIK